MSFGFGFGIPFARVPASGAAALSYDPADLPWNSGAKRFWWHFDDGGMFKAADGGGGGATVFGDAVASLQSGSGTGTYWLNQAGGVSGVLRTDGVELPYLAQFEGSLGSQDDSVTGGFTIGFCGYISAGTFALNYLCVGGHDSSPQDHALRINHNSLEASSWSTATYAASIDWTVPHRVIAVGEYVGSTVTIRIYLDGVLVSTTTGLTAGSWSRDLLFANTSGVTWNMRSRFVAAQAFTSDANIALIDRFLCLGATPLQVAGGWTAWIESFKASLLDYGYAEDLTRLWQDDTATTPVASAGDAVGAWRGQKDTLTLIQPTAGNRPYYQTAGVRLDGTTGAARLLYATYSRDVTSEPVSLGMSMFGISTTQPMRYGAMNGSTSAAAIVAGWGQSAGVQHTYLRGTGTSMTAATGRRQYAVSLNVSSARLMRDVVGLSSPGVGVTATAVTHINMSANTAAADARVTTWFVKSGAMTDDDLTRAHYWLRYRRHLE